MVTLLFYCPTFVLHCGYGQCHRSLSALRGDIDIVQNLDRGAVDCVSKPFDPQVLAARARASLRRAETVSRTVRDMTYSDDRLTIDPTGRRVLVRGEAVNLTKIEYQKFVLFRKISFDRVLVPHHSFCR